MWSPLQHASTFMTEGLKRVEQEAQEFRDKVEQCRDKANSSMADIKDAYSRLHRLRDRYQYEAHKVLSLEPGEKEALRKVFEDDTFIKGMGKVRGISEHVEMGEVVLRQTDGSALKSQLPSAAAVFADRCVHLFDTAGDRHRVDHLERLTEAERRISRAMAKARRCG